MPGISIEPDSVETNIVYFDVEEAVGSARFLCDALHKEGVWMLPIGPQRVRAVTHLDVSSEDIEQAIRVLHSILKSKGLRHGGVRSEPRP